MLYVIELNIKFVTFTKLVEDGDPRISYMVVRVGGCRGQLPRPRRLVGERANQLWWRLLRKTCVADRTTRTSGRGRGKVLLLLGRRRPHGHVTVSGKLSIRGGDGGDHFCGWRDGKPSILTLPFLSTADASFNL